MLLRASREAGLPRIVSIQNAYGLLNRVYEIGLSEISRRENVPLIPYSPLAFGHLSGKYLAGSAPAQSRLVRFPPFGQRYDKPKVASSVAAYTTLAGQTGLSPATMALVFVRSRWFVASTIIGATTLAQLDETSAVSTPFCRSTRWRRSTPFTWETPILPCNVPGLSGGLGGSRGKAQAACDSGSECADGGRARLARTSPTV